MNILREDRRRLAEDLRLLVRDAEGILKHKVDDAGEGFLDARERLERRLDTARRERFIVLRVWQPGSGFFVN